MKLTSLILFLFLLPAVMIPIFGQNYDLYFSNNETDFIQSYKPGQLELGFCVVATGESSTNIQMGYSPIKHLSIAAGYYYQNGRDNLRSSVGELDRSAFSFSVGTYYYLENNKREKYKPNTRIIDLEKRRSFLLTAMAGYSNNQMESAGEIDNFTGVVFYKGEIKYQSVFLNLGIGYEYNLGRIITSVGFRRIRYDKAVFTGSGFDVEKVNDIVAQLRKETNYNIVNIGIQSQFGKKSVKLLTGLNMPLIYFQNFKNQAAEIESPSFYLGFLLDINGALHFFRGVFSGTKNK